MPESVSCEHLFLVAALSLYSGDADPLNLKMELSLQLIVVLDLCLLLILQALSLVL